METDPKDEDAGPEEVEVEPYPEEPYPPDEVVVEPYWPPALSEPKAAAVAASISGLSSFMIWGGSSQTKSHHSHLVDEVNSLSGGFTDGLVDCGAGLLWDAGALLLVLGGALLFLDSGARLSGGCSANVLHNLLAHLLRPASKLRLHRRFLAILTWCHTQSHTCAR